MGGLGVAAQAAAAPAGIQPLAGVLYLWRVQDAFR
jgi:hypothetical protein